jgi:hypothetical protein
MPYIKKGRREQFSVLGLTSPDNAGELNYMFTKIARDYLERQGECYQTYNDLIGALECCKLELYRRKVSWYEEKKIIENGDVWYE